MNYNVISADNHVIEPRDLFVTRMPKEFRDRAPRVVRGKDGGDGWSLDGVDAAVLFGTISMGAYTMSPPDFALALMQTYNDWLLDDFSTDYPHSFCLWPDTAKYIETVTRNVDPAAKKKILADTAARLFGLN